jgi:sulfate-transporting ATPase
LVVTIPVGIVVALPAVRARGVNLAVATLGLAIIINSVILANPKYTGGVIRGTVVSPPSLFGLSLDPQQHPERYAMFCLICLAVGALLVGNLRRGAAGRGLIAIRSNERAAASLGINVAGGKLYAFALGAGLAALAGVLSAFRTSFVSFEKYNVFASVSAILQSVIGGIGFVSGGIAAGITAPDAVAVQLVNHVVDIGDWFALIAAVLLIALVIVHPDGIAEMAVHLKGLVLARVNRSKPSPPAPSSATIGSASRGRPERVAPLALQLDSISVRFGSVMAVNDLSLRVEPGQVVGLIGPNGAGKTTVVDAVSGFVRYRGSVRLGDTALDGLTPAQRAGAGVVRSFQSLELFEDMTVEENLRTASEERSVGGSLRELVRPRRRELTDTAVACVEEFQLGAVLGSKPSALPYARRREVAIARAVALGPSVLLLDEPAAGLDSASRSELTHLIRRLADEWGIGVLLIEHDVAMVLGVCDQVTVINFGAELVSGSPAAVRRDQRVIDAYLGGSAVDAESLAAR